MDSTCVSPTAGSVKVQDDRLEMVPMLPFDVLHSMEDCRRGKMGGRIQGTSSSRLWSGILPLTPNHYCKLRLNQAEIVLFLLGHVNTLEARTHYGLHEIFCPASRFGLLLCA